MSMDELTALLRQIERSAFRLETLSRYRAPGERELLEAFRHGRPLPPRNPDTEPWLRMVAESIAAGRSWSRVHTLARPLSEYLQFALLGYQGNLLAGEDVRIADLDMYPGVLDALDQDFWLLDDSLVFVMRYDADGRLVGMDRTTEAAPFVAHRDLAIANSVALNDYLPIVKDELHRSW